MAPLIPLLIQALPSIVNLFDAPESVKKITQDASDIAQVITGTKNVDDAIAVLGQDPAKFAEFKLALEEKELEWERLYIADKKSARERDARLHEAGYRNTRANVMFFLAVCMIGALVYIVWKDPGINEYVKGIFTLVLGRFLGYLDNIYSFEFGTTRGSKQKDETIEKLSQK